jgi:FtsZ-interacting cell division protein YlmF
MASVWQKTLFYLGLVDDDQIEAAEEASAKAPQAQVRTVEPPRPVQQTTPAAATTPSPPPTPAQAAPPPPRAQGQVAGRRIEPPSQQRRRISGNPEHAEAGVLVRTSDGTDYGRDAARPLGYDPSAGQAEVIAARTFTDAQTLADHLRNDRPVVLDLRNAEAAMVRRLVDFASGLTYGLNGRMVKIAQGVILVTPPAVSIGMEERRRLAGLGLYTVPIEG